MALRSLVEAVHRLNISGTPAFRTTAAAAAEFSLTRWSTCTRSWLHTSCCAMRNLDNRAQPKYTQPSHKWGRWQPRQKMSELYEYTVKPLPFPKTGGRGPNGRIWNFKRVGGHKRNFRMIDWDRGGPELEGGAPRVEKVAKICYDPNRSARIALVAGKEHKRYIVATENMKAGDMVKSTRVVSKTPVRAKEGDSYPLGSLPIGTLVNNIEIYPGAGSIYIRAAGTSGRLLRKVDGQCVVKLPSKREVSVAETCVGVVGRVSNVDHNKRVIGKAGRKRWLGFKPRSGRWHRKTGRFGRKIKPVKRMRTYNEDMKRQPKVLLHKPYSVDWKRQLPI